MLKPNPITKLKKWAGIVLAIFTLLQVNACVSKNAFLTSAVVPAARGNVKVKKDNNQNYLIQINITYLAESDRLQPPKNTYVVWMETQQDMAKNIGQINNTQHSAAKNMKASFETVSAFDPVRIFITAENDATASYPGTPVVLTTGKIK